MPDLTEPPFSARPPARTPRECRSHAQGHTPHVIQVRLCHESPDAHWLRVVVMDAGGEVITLAVGDELRSYRNHEADRLAAVVTSVGAEALFNVQRGVLFLRPWPGGARSVFSVQAAERPLGECRAAL